MRIAVYPRSFDPITLWNMDIIRRASKVFEKVVVCIVEKPDEKGCLFTVEERKKLAEKAVAEFGNVEVDTGKEPIFELMSKYGNAVIVHGLRYDMDFEREYQLEKVNKKLNTSIETMFFATDTSFVSVDSAGVRELASHNVDLKLFLPECIVDEVTERLQQK